MTELSEQLQRLDGHLAANSVSRFWLPGLSGEGIVARSRGLLPPPPQDALDWYGWHAGIDHVAAAAAYEQRDRYNVAISPDQWIHDGLDTHVDYLQRTKECFAEDGLKLSDLFPIDDMFPLASDPGGSIHWLYRQGEEWRLWQTTKELDLQTSYHEPDWGLPTPTLLEWTTALNEAFDRGDVYNTEGGGGPIHAAGNFDDGRHYGYPWPPRPASSESAVAHRIAQAKDVGAEHLTLSFDLVQIPAAVAELQTLTSLSFAGNQFQRLSSEDIEILSQLPDLSTLAFPENQLREISADIGRLTSLTQLDLSYNELTHLPEEVGDLSNLDYMIVRKNQLEELPEQLGHLTKLRNLAVDHNRLRSLPAVLGRLPNLHSLQADNNPLVDIPDEIRRIDRFVT